MCEVLVMEMEFPICMAWVKRMEITGKDGNEIPPLWDPEFNVGKLIPCLITADRERPSHYKAWVCTNPDCDFNLKIRNGDIVRDEPIKSGSDN